MTDLVLLTGATGMVGYRVLVQLLEAGYAVRTAVRNQAGFDKIRALKPTAAYLDRITSVIVPDITVPGAYDEAVQGVKYIIHTASPVPVTKPDVTDYEKEIIQPAVRGTISVLEAAKKSTGIQRIVITGSSASTICFSECGSSEVFDESHRSTLPQKPYTNKVMAYRASKAMTFNATHEWMGIHQPSFDIINLQPTFVIGRDDTVTDAENFNQGSNYLITGPLLAGSNELLPTPWPGISVHLDDVAMIHVKSLEESIVGNQDFLITSQQPNGTEWAKAFSIVKTAYPNECADGLFKIHTESRPATSSLRMSSAKAEKTFNIKFKSFEDQVISVMDHYLELLGRK